MEGVETETERNEYTYRQSVTLDELDSHGAARGQYRESRDIIFSPQHERSENLIGQPENGLKNLILTELGYDIRKPIGEIVAEVPEIKRYARVESVQFSNVPSSYITPIGAASMYQAITRTC